MIGLEGWRSVASATLLDQSRDLRSVGAAMIYALLGPVAMLLVFSQMAEREAASARPLLAVVGAEHAPVLIRHLARAGMRVEPRAGDAGRELRNADAVLIIPPHASDAIRSGRTARLRLIRDERRQRSVVAAARIERQLDALGDELVVARLAAQTGLPARRPFIVEGVNVAGMSARGVTAVGMLLYFLLLAPFFTSMTSAIDATAGERERQSLKPLLAQPIDTGGLLLGKVAVSALFGIVGTAVTIVGAAVMLRFAPLEAIGIGLLLDGREQMLIILLLTPLAIAVASLQNMVALLARSFKEAQTYIQLLSLAPLALLFSTVFSGDDPSRLERALPLLGQSDLIRRLLVDGALDQRQIAEVTATSLVLAAICLVAGERYLRNERLTGRG